MKRFDEVARERKLCDKVWACDFGRWGTLKTDRRETHHQTADAHNPFPGNSSGHSKRGQIFSPTVREGELPQFFHSEM